MLVPVSLRIYGLKGAQTQSAHSYRLLCTYVTEVIEHIVSVSKHVTRLWHAVIYTWIHLTSHQIPYYCVDVKFYIHDIIHIIVLCSLMQFLYY
jgi:hypothetical protein